MSENQNTSNEPEMSKRNRNYTIILSGMSLALLVAFVLLMGRNHKTDMEVENIRNSFACADYLQKNGLGTVNDQQRLKDKAEQSALNMRQLSLLQPSHDSTYVLVGQMVVPAYLQPMCGGYVIDKAKSMPLSDMLGLLEDMKQESQPVQPNGRMLKVMSNAEVMHEWCRSVDLAKNPICAQIDTREYYRQPGFSTALQCWNHEQENTEYFSCKVYEINGEVFHDVFFDPILGYYIGRQDAMQYLLNTQGKKLSIGHHSIILLNNGSMNGCLANTCVAFKHP